MSIRKNVLSKPENKPDVNPFKHPVLFPYMQPCSISSFTIDELNTLLSSEKNLYLVLFEMIYCNPKRPYYHNLYLPPGETDVRVFTMGHKWERYHFTLIINQMVLTLRNEISLFLDDVMTYTEEYHNLRIKKKLCYYTNLLNIYYMTSKKKQFTIQLIQDIKTMLENNSAMIKKSYDDTHKTFKMDSSDESAAQYEEFSSGELTSTDSDSGEPDCTESSSFNESVNISKKVSTRKKSVIDEKKVTTKQIRDLTEKENQIIVGRQHYVCANAPGTKIKELEGYECPYWKLAGKGQFDGSGYEIDFVAENFVPSYARLRHFRAFCVCCHSVLTSRSLSK